MKRQNSFHTVTALLLFLLAVTGNSDAQIRAANGKEITNSEMDKFLRHEMDSIGLPGLSIAIITNGKISYHRALGVTNIDTKKKVDENSLFEAASMSKPLFTFFVMKMVEKGQLDLDKPLYQYWPYPDIAYDERYKLITARMVLTHTSGLPNWRDCDEVDSSLHIRHGDLYLKFTPGARYSYSGEGFIYLARVIAYLNHLTLKDLQELFEQEVAAPMGLRHAWYVWDDFLIDHKVSGHLDGKPYYRGWPVCGPGWDSTWFLPASCLHTEAMTYARFLVNIMEYKNLKKQYIDEMLKAQYRFQKENGYYPADGDSAWGLSLGIRPTKYGPVYWHGGTNQSFQGEFVFSMERKDGYVFFTNCDRGFVFNRALDTFLTEGK